MTSVIPLLSRWVHTLRDLIVVRVFGGERGAMIAADSCYTLPPIPPSSEQLSQRKAAVREPRQTG
jgi:hypothetical protein